MGYFILKNNVCTNCHSNNCLFTVLNERGDASFRYYVNCLVCDSLVGKIDWNNNLVFYKSPITRSNDNEENKTKKYFLNISKHVKNDNISLLEASELIYKLFENIEYCSCDKKVKD